MEVGSSTLPGTTNKKEKKLGLRSATICIRGGISSVGLEHLPCTQGVKGSSPLFSTVFFWGAKRDDKKERSLTYWTKRKEYRANKKVIIEI